MWAANRSEDDVDRGPFQIKEEGLDDVIRRLEEYEIDTDRAIRQALQAASQHIASEADEMVPEDEGQLSASQNIENVKKSGDRYVASISYGGPSAPYAIVQHENFDLFHPPKPPGRRKVGGRQGSGPTNPGDRTNGGPKYLEYPFDRETEEWPSGFRDRLINAGWRLLKG